MDSTDRRVVELFAAFEKEREPGRVHEALDTIEAADRDLPAGDQAWKQAVAHFLRFFDMLDSHIDPKWNQNDEPVTCVRPPLSSSGVIYPNGEVDPSTITDPAERTLYEQALEANKNKSKRHFIQFQLRQINERAMVLLERLLAEKYASSSAAGGEFKELLRASPVSNTRKEQLRKLWPNEAK